MPKLGKLRVICFSLHVVAVPHRGDSDGEGRRRVEAVRRDCTQSQEGVQEETASSARPRRILSGSRIAKSGYMISPFQK